MTRDDRPPSAEGRDRFRSVLFRTIAMLDEVLDRPQLLALADSCPTICWEFPDAAWQAWLIVDRDPPGLRLESGAQAESGLVVVMDSTVLYAAAAGETSLGMSFINGRLQVRGLNPLFLAKFVKLIDPLLRCFRAAVEEVHERAA